MFNINVEIDDHWHSALHIAVQNRQPELINLLIFYGADVDLINVDFLTPIDLNALCHNDVEIYEILLRAGGKPNKFTVLMHHVKCLERFIKKETTKFDINARLDKYFNTALHLAVQLKQIELINLLITRGANVNIKNIKNETPIDTNALFHNSDEIYKILLNSGAQPNRFTVLSHNKKYPNKTKYLIKARELSDESSSDDGF